MSAQDSGQIPGLLLEAEPVDAGVYSPTYSDPAPKVEERPPTRPARDAKGRFPKGTTEGHRFEPGNRAVWKHGARSREMQAGRLPEQQAIAAAIREQAQAVVDDLGGPDQVSAVKAALIEDWIRLGVWAGGLAQHLEAGGLLTGKGRTKAAASLWLSILDRRHRVAEKIGLMRVPKRVAALDDVIASIAARKTQTQEDQ